MVVLVFNCGSSSLKYELFETDPEQSLAAGIADRVVVRAGRDASLYHEPADGEPLVLECPMPDHEVAVGYVLEALTDSEHGVIRDLTEIAAVGHRVVHGGERFAESVLIDDDVIAAIEQFARLAPLHNPPNLQGIRASRSRLPSLPMVAVFDTAFHQTMPQYAYIYGLPYELYEQHGIRRYGFHGTSHRYVSQVAAEMLAQRGIRPQDQHIVTCHLGNGCSMAAVLGGKCIDTTMGFTPLEGLVMGTRCGDLDPAVVPYLCEKLGISVREVDALMNERSGLLGLSGVSSDMRDLRQAAQSGDERAKLAIEVFCYRVRKYIGAYAAALGGVDAVVFTAGIGENDAYVRRRCVEGLETLGLCLDGSRNEDKALRGQAADVSAADSPGRILVIPTDEELLIARDTAAIVGGTSLD